MKTHCFKQEIEFIPHLFCEKHLIGWKLPFYPKKNIPLEKLIELFPYALYSHSNIGFVSEQGTEIMLSGPSYGSKSDECWISIKPALNLKNVDSWIIEEIIRFSNWSRRISS